MTIAVTPNASRSSAARWRVRCGATNRQSESGWRHSVSGEKWRASLVVGVASDARYRGLERPSMEVYVPHQQSTTGLGSFVIGTSTHPPSDTMIRQALLRVEPELAIEKTQTTDQLMHSVLSPARLLATLTSLLSAAGVLLLALGIFGAAAVALRTAWPEIAVRQAIGAKPFEAARAPLAVLARALAIGIGLGRCFRRPPCRQRPRWGCPARKVQHCRL